MFSIPSLLLLLISISLSAAKLKYVQVIFRHGDRAPMQLPYPNDPYGESTWPRGWTQLTNQGILQGVEFGEYLRKHYNGFISTEYQPKQIYARSSYPNRVIETVQSVLYGLYRDSTNNDDRLNYWRPIAVHSEDPSHVDVLLHPDKLDCTHRMRLINETYERTERELRQSYHKLFKMAQAELGVKNFTYTEHASRLREVNIEIGNGHIERQPAFMTRRWPEYNNRTTYEIMYSWRERQVIERYDQPEKFRPVGGILLNDFIKQAVSVTKGQATSRLRLYGSHDLVIAGLMYTMGIANDLLVPPVAALIMEIHKKSDDFTVQFFFRNSSTHDPYPMKIPNCDTPCTVQDFANIYKDLVLTTKLELYKYCKCANDKCNDNVPFNQQQH